MALLELTDVSRRFGGLAALSGVTLALEPGEVVGLIGPNGAGKTTLVNVITGVHRATSGRVVFDGKDVTGQKPFRIARSGIARTFQIVQPFPAMSVLENVAAAAIAAGHAASVREAQAIARDQLRFVGLAEIASMPAASLTLAMRKRLELAKSLAMRPKLLLLDEVNAGLNATEIGQAMRLIREIANQGMTIVIIEHLIKVVVSLSSKIVVLHQGKLVVKGPPKEVLRDPMVIEAYLGRRYSAAERAHV